LTHCHNTFAHYFRCQCVIGTMGTNCETDNRNECMYNRCQNNGQCIARPGDYACRCAASYRGKNCEIFDAASPGGVNIAVDQNPSLFFVLNMPLERFHDHFKTLFEWFLSVKLGTTMRVKHDENGHAIVYPYDPQEMQSDQIYTTFDTGLDFLSNDIGQTIVVFVEIDNNKCGNQCFSTSREVANYIAAAYSEELKKDWGVVQIGETKTNNLAGTALEVVKVGIIIIVLVFVAISVLVSKAKGVTWFPKSFRTHSTSQSGISEAPHGQDLEGNCRMQYGWSDEDKWNRRDHSQTIMSVMSDTDLDTCPPSANAEVEFRAEHLYAAGMLTPSEDDNEQMQMTNEVDVRGPCGLTPLMCASFLPSGLYMADLCNEEEGKKVESLIDQGADIKLQMDKTGETPLHLAARYARADAAKKLLDAKADANAPDNNGRTPLHAAVAADAQGVFNILKMHRATDINAKTFDGTTPLILAARLAIEGMAEELIQLDADINASDENGKSALHWAASVNNVHAVNTLLASGADRNAQDHKKETPLFLACRERHFQAVKALLDHCADRDVTDDIDRLPRDVAQERLHHDIVRLLEEHVPPSPQPQVFLPILPPKLPTNKSQESSVLSPPNMGMTLKPKKRRPSVRRKKIGRVMSGMILSPSAGILGDSSTSPQQQMLQLQNSSSPIMSPLLPTSPTHLQDMCSATNQRHQFFQFFEFPEQQIGGNIPSLPQTRENYNFLTPSLESPGQWSNTWSQSDFWWSDYNVHTTPDYFQQHPFNFFP